MYSCKGKEKGSHTLCNESFLRVRPDFIIHCLVILKDMNAWDLEQGVANLSARIDEAVAG